MNTPLYDFLEKYAGSNTLRMHMPGHKGRAFGNFGSIYPYDITEISGADSLFEAEGVIAESERNAASLFGTAATLYSAEGSTLCIQAMLALMKRENRHVIAVRNVHRSFLSACALLGTEPEWIYPKYTGGILSGDADLRDIEKALSEHENSCLYITSPDYLGKTADIPAISEICRRYGAALLVDNAHGAHSAFMPENRHPIHLGADMCCDSAHKMLPALTGAAYLHIGNKRYAGGAKTAMSLFASTSPSYLIMGSLDLCNRYIAGKIRADLEYAVSRTEELKRRISEKYEVYDGEPLHLTLLCNGNKAAQELRKQGIECEYADGSCIVLLLSPVNTEEDFTRLEKALMSISPERGDNAGIKLPVMEKAVPLREAVLSEFETIPAEQAEGRICAFINVPCPPAVPIAVSGEIISRECIKIYKRYGIINVNVLK